MSDNDIPEGYLPEAFRKPKAPLPSRSDEPGEINFEADEVGPPGFFSFLLLGFICPNLLAFAAGMVGGCTEWNGGIRECAPRAKWRYVFPGWTAGAMFRSWLDTPEWVPTHIPKIVDSPALNYVILPSGGMSTAGPGTPVDEKGMWQYYCWQGDLKACTKFHKLGGK